MADYGFSIGNDFSEFWENGSDLILENAHFKSPQQAAALGYQKNHILALDMAKHIAMIQRTPEGKAICGHAEPEDMTVNNSFTVCGELRTIVKDGEPWFRADDVCKALSVYTSAVSQRLDDDEKVTLRLTQGETSRTSDVVFISESGLYSLVLGSRKPQSHAFKRWVMMKRGYTQMNTPGGVQNLVDSRFVAQEFGKQHQHVLRDVDVLDCSPEFRLSNFGRSDYINAQGHKQPCYYMTRDGFMFRGARQGIKITVPARGDGFAYGHFEGSVV